MDLTTLQDLLNFDLTIAIRISKTKKYLLPILRFFILFSLASSFFSRCNILYIFQ